MKKINRERCFIVFSRVWKNIQSNHEESNLSHSHLALTLYLWVSKTLWGEKECRPPSWSIFFLRGKPTTLSSSLQSLQRIDLFGLPSVRWPETAQSRLLISRTRSSNLTMVCADFIQSVFDVWVPSYHLNDETTQTRTLSQPLSIQSQYTPGTVKTTWVLGQHCSSLGYMINNSW